MKMTVFGVLLQLTAVTAAASMSLRKSSAVVYPLDMAENSVDDSYEGCRNAMEKLVQSKYIEHEIKNTPGFEKVWNNALNKFPKDEPNRKQYAAIYLYTGNKDINKPCSYREFNAATRNGKAEYQANTNGFKFYTLFFYLTDAVQKLKQKQNQPGYLTTYRRTDIKFPTEVVNKNIRFGSFTSTSTDMPPLRFGNKSCFEVETYFGADVTKYSKFPHESEVLIPPYEVFRVTSVDKNTWCDVVYKLKSTKKMRSDLQCAKIKKYHPN